ncbi:MAG TPA: helix-turn-helix domain-containing protein [bacterium]|nr:helix-turn-helix domain-containing protein [bacterium]
MPRKSRNGGEGRKAALAWRHGKEETRETLCLAALDLFARKGYRGTSVRDLAGAAGVTTGAFYSNFRSKRDIYIAIIDKITGTVQVMVDETAREIIEVMKKRGNAHMDYELLRRPLYRLLEEAERHQSLMHILRREGLGQDPEFQLDIDRVWERFVHAAKRALDMYVEAGFAKAYDTELVARALVPMSIAMSLYDQQTGGARRAEIVSLLASMLQGGASQWVAWSELEKKERRREESGRKERG